jgi:hypothetical protein
VIVVTEWNEFKNIDLPRVHDNMRHPVLIDGRNLYEPQRMEALGFVYRGIGRGYGGSGARGEQPDVEGTSAAAPSSTNPTPAITPGSDGHPEVEAGAEDEA